MKEIGESKERYDCIIWFALGVVYKDIVLNRKVKYKHT